MLSAVKQSKGRVLSERDRLSQVGHSVAKAILQRFEEPQAVDNLGFSVIFFKRLSDF